MNTIRLPEARWYEKWDVVTLGEICHIQIGKTPPTKNQQYWNGPHTWISISDMNSRKIVNSERTVTEKAIADGEVRLVKQGTLLMSFKLTIGKLAFAGKDLFTNEAIAALVIKDEYKEEVEPEYLYWVLQVIPLEKDAALAVKGKTINKKTMKVIRLPLPKPNEQRRIVARLEALLGEVRKMHELQSQIEADVGRLMESVLAEVFAPYTEGPTKTINEVANVKGGKRLPKGENFASGITAYPYLRVRDFHNFSIDRSDLQYLTPEIYQRIKRYTISTDNIYISIAGTIGLVGTVPEGLNGANLTENAAKIVFKPAYKDKIDKEFLVFYLASPFGRRQIEERSKAAGQPKLALMRIKTIKIPVLQSLTEQASVVAYIKIALEEINAMRLAVEKDNRALDALEQAILAQAFRGEL